MRGESQAMAGGTRAATATSQKPCAAATGAPRATARPGSHTAAQTTRSPPHPVFDPVEGWVGSSARVSSVERLPDPGLVDVGFGGWLVAAGAPPVGDHLQLAECGDGGGRAG